MLTEQTQSSTLWPALFACATAPLASLICPLPPELCVAVVLTPPPPRSLQSCPGGHPNFLYTKQIPESAGGAAADIAKRAASGADAAAQAASGGGGGRGGGGGGAAGGAKKLEGDARWCKKCKVVFVGAACSSGHPIFMCTLTPRLRLAPDNSAPDTSLSCSNTFCRALLQTPRRCPMAYRSRPTWGRM